MELAEMLQPYINAGLVSVMERDVDGDAALYAAHNFRVPVVLEGDREILWGRVSPAELIAAFGHHDVAHRQT